MLAVLYNCFIEDELFLTDIIISQTFYNEKLMSIIRTLITGIGNSHKNETADNFLPGYFNENIESITIKQF